MAKTFAGEAAGEIGSLGANLRDAADGFAAVTSQVQNFTAAREANVAVAGRELAVIKEGLSVAESFQGIRTTSSPSGGGSITTSSGGDSGLISTSTPINQGTTRHTVDRFGRIPPLLRGVLTGSDRIIDRSTAPMPTTSGGPSGGSGGGSGGFASFNQGQDFGAALRKAPPSAGERRIESAINKGFASLRSGGGAGGGGAAAADFRSRQEF